MVLGVGSSLMGLSDPYRADMVAVSGEVTGKNALSYMHCRMKANTEGRLILKDRPTINTQTVDFDHLKSLAPNSLGHTYVKFCKKHKITPDSRDPVQYVDDEDLAYVMKRSGDCSIITGLVKWDLLSFDDFFWRRKIQLAAFYNQSG